MHAAELRRLRGMTYHIWDLEQVPQGLPLALFAVNCCVVAVGMKHCPSWPACVDHHQPNISVALHLQHRTPLVAGSLQVQNQKAGWIIKISAWLDIISAIPADLPSGSAMITHKYTYLASAPFEISQLACL